MKGGAQTALALAVGYVLGRRRKMRTTTALAVAAVTGGLGRLGPAALRRGAKLLTSTDLADTVGPQFGEIAATVRGELLDAGKAAAAAAVSSRIESLSDNLHERAEALRNPQSAVAGAGEAAGSLRRRGDESGGGAEHGRRDGSGRRDAGRRSEENGRSEGSGRRRGPGRRAGSGQREEDGDERPRPGRRARAGSRQDQEPEDDFIDDEADVRDADDEDEMDEPTSGRDEPEEGDADEPPRRSRRPRSPVTRTSRARR